MQTSLALRSSNKLSFRYFGPYKILAKIGDAAYKLQLPVDCNVYPVFHVSLLKKVVNSSTVVSSELPDLSHEWQVPQLVLDRRLHQLQDKMIPQVLVQWSQWPAELATWEDEEALRQQFPKAPAWGQADSDRGRNVTDQVLKLPKTKAGGKR